MLELGVGWQGSQQKIKELVETGLGYKTALRKALLYLSFEDGDSLGPAARAFMGELRYQTMNLPSSDFIHDT